MAEWRWRRAAFRGSVCYHTVIHAPYFFPSFSSLILAILKSFAKATIDSPPDILSSHSPEGFLLWKEIAGYTISGDLNRCDVVRKTTLERLRPERWEESLKYKLERGDYYVWSWSRGRCHISIFRQWPLAEKKNSFFLSTSALNFAQFWPFHVPFFCDDFQVFSSFSMMPV